ncbi:MAG: VOC family protein, partial [Bacteroidota bacterium]
MSDPTNGNVMTIRYAHTNIVSANWKALVDFYVKTFQCKVVPPIRNQSGDWLEKGTGVRGAKLEGAHLLLPGHGEKGPTLEIYQYAHVDHHPPIDPNTKGFGHIAFEVDDVADVLSRLKHNGGSSNGEVVVRQVEGAGEITFVYARDPEGNLIELQ